MNIKRYILAGLAVFASLQAMDFLQHGVILAKTYQELKHLWRPDMMSLMWVMYLSSLVMSFAFAGLYVRGYRGGGIRDGLVFGFLIGLFINVMGMFGQYAMYPLPFSLTLLWFVFGMIEFLVAGAVVALVYRED